MGMLLLLFNVGGDVHAIDAASVVEVLPLVDIRALHHPPKGVIGTLNYCGAFVPVIDLSDLLLGRRASARLSTRIILARYSTSGEMRLVGIVAENATETLRCNSADLIAPGLMTDGAPYLGPVVKGPRGFIQRIEVDKLVGTVMPDILLSA